MTRCSSWHQIPRPLAAGIPLVILCNIMDLRELCAVAALCVLNRGNELKSHIIAAVRAGATRSEVVEVILQMSTYGGMPVCIEGLTIAKKVFDKTKSSN